MYKYLALALENYSIKRHEKRLEQANSANILNYVLVKEQKMRRKIYVEKESIWSVEKKKTLPHKAQRTRGLSSYHKFKHKS